jgi:uncharacterized protein (TIGR02246 family)
MPVGRRRQKVDVMRMLFSLSLLPALVLGPACAPKVNDPADVQAVTQVVKAYVQAVNAGDASGSVAMMADNAVYLEAHMPAITGKPAIEAFLRTVFGQWSIQMTASVSDLRVSGDLAVVRGVYAQTVRPKAPDVAAEVDSGHWTAVMQRGPDGSWACLSTIGSSDQPLPGTTAGGADERALMEIERGFVTAVNARDMAFFDRVLAKEYAQWSDGKPVNVAEQLAAIRAGHVRFESMAIRDMKVHVAGDGAIVSMAAESKGTYKGTPFVEKSTGIDFFAKRDGRWQLVNSQATTIKE